MGNPNAPKNLDEPTRFENVTQANAWENLQETNPNEYADNNPEDSTDIGPESDGDLYSEEKAQTIETEKYGDSTPEVIASETSEEIELPANNDELEAMAQAEQNQAQEVDNYYAEHPDELAKDLEDTPETPEATEALETPSIQ